MKSNIKDVASLAEVSIATVSRFLHTPERVAENTRQRIADAIQQLNYAPNALARGLILRRTQTLGVVIPDISNLFYAEVLKGMEDAAHNRKYNLILGNTDNNKDRLFSTLRVLKERQIDGLVFTSEPVFPDYHDLFMQLQIPVVLASTHSLEYELPSVKVNDEQAGYDAAEYLIRQGHRRIGMICGSLYDPVTAVPRLNGFMRALRTHSIQADFETCVVQGHYHFENGYEAMGQLLAKFPDMTAVFASSDERAVGAILYLHEHGLKVPDDISVIGFDNSRLSQMCYPRLTTVAQPLYDIGQKAVEKLDMLIQGHQDDELRTYVPHRIVERHSVRQLL